MDYNDDDPNRSDLDDIVEHIQMFAMFLMALNDVNEDESLYIRDTLFELLSPEGDTEIEDSGNRKPPDKNAN